MISLPIKISLKGLFEAFILGNNYVLGVLFFTKIPKSGWALNFHTGLLKGSHCQNAHKSVYTIVLHTCQMLVYCFQRFSAVCLVASPKPPNLTAKNPLIPKQLQGMCMFCLFLCEVQGFFLKQCFKKRKARVILL